MKIIVSILIVVAVLAGGFFWFNSYIYQEKQAEVERETVSGVVTEINRDAVAYDGPSIITITTDMGETKTIEVPSMGLPLCEAYPNITDVWMLEVGDSVEITGNVNPETRGIIPCESVEHYLRATATFVDPALGLQFNYRRGPDGYVLQTAPHGNEEEADFEELYILMLKKDYDLMQTLEGTEGPPSITIGVYRNTKKMQAGNWVDANPGVSNSGLAISEPAETVIGGANAVRYTVDGLYRIDTVVVAHGGFIFVISGAYLEEDSTIREDFMPLLQSVTFVQRPEEE